MQPQAEPTHDKFCPFNLTQSPNVCDCGESDRLFAEVRRALMDAGMIWEDDKRGERKNHGFKKEKQS
jgi:hypothetical protein